MKRFWLVLLSLGLVMAFSASALAVDFKVSGEYYVGGYYLDKTTFKKDTGSDGPSTALYYQRLRVTSDFIVAPGLKFTTRFDVMERAWGAARTAPGTGLDSNSNGTTAENENIAFDMAYVTYTSPIGEFMAGYLPDGGWGTVFGNTVIGAPKLSYGVMAGPIYILLQYQHVKERSSTAKVPSLIDDNDADAIYPMFFYFWKTGQVGLLTYYQRDATPRPGGFKTEFYILDPYIIAQFGPVKLQAEVSYTWGKFIKSEVAGLPDLDISGITGWVDATAAFGPVYFGGSVAYVSGDDPNTTDKLEGFLSGGSDYNPCLILWNYDRTYWTGAIAGQGGSANGSAMTNAWLFQGRAGVKPTDKWDIMASVSYAFADKKPKVAGVEFGSDKYGTEVDITATYKITNNLSYMLGFGYLFTGDYFKGTSTLSVRDDYLVMNKLTLTF